MHENLVKKKIKSSSMLGKKDAVMRKFAYMRIPMNLMNHEIVENLARIHLE